ncbi:SCO family protein [Streptomyces sp. NPDC088725]|uniref:SCO family protein n=1 Tax=Streptomyces sp. NPDC088725 TaxID=3365873 RepID=UPI0037FB167B
MRKNLVPAAALAIAAVLTLSACGSDSDDSSSKPVADVSTQGQQKPATVLDQPFEKPDLVLKDTKGATYDLREATKGKPTLIYFGYTNCPDVCPLTMSNLAIARKSLTKAEQDQLQVVFITTDPERDTSAELAKWLPAAGDPSFTGLTGDFTDIQAGARKLGIAIEAPEKQKDGTVLSMHGAQVIAFSPKTDAGYVLYNDDTSADDYAKDLPKIIKGENP